MIRRLREAERFLAVAIGEVVKQKNMLGWWNARRGLVCVEAQ